jgi:hypothetical protein
MNFFFFFFLFICLFVFFHKNRTAKKAHPPLCFHGENLRHTPGAAAWVLGAQGQAHSVDFKDSHRLGGMFERVVVVVVVVFFFVCSRA